MTLSTTPEAAAGPRRLRIIHFAYEDKRQPGAGGGSVRTHEINKRLARNHDITVVAAGWPGAADRVEDGVRYRHAGSGRTRARALAYFARLPWRAMTADADLIVEDFGAPISTVGLPWFTGTPVVAMVQWLFADRMARKYRLPLHLIEHLGVRAHRHFIAVSEDLASTLASRRPGTRVDVVPNGVEEIAFAADAGRVAPRDRPSIAFLGRIDTAQKGLDVLIRALPSLPTRSLAVIGDGPDEAELRRLARALGVDTRISWLGRVEGQAKYDLLAAAGVVAVPSRFETFGMVAVEALAAGTPVVASDIDCLRQVVPGTVGHKVPVDRPDLLAEALRSLLEDEATAARLGSAGREFARGFNWEHLAAQQERIYLSAAGEPRPRHLLPRSRFRRAAASDEIRSLA
jgi:glycosyltransferase involved in cell wall biosynthesis